MSKKKRVHYQLSDTKGLTISEKEVAVILRAADDIIFEAGRNMLAKILKGSKAKDVLAHHLNECPSYGYYHTKTIEEITRHIDWMIVNDFLEISYNGRLPMIVFSEKGWETYKPIYANELYQKILTVKEKDKKVLVESLIDVNRQVVVILLNDIGNSRNTDFIKFLQEWAVKEAKKVRVKINGAINQLNHLK